MIAFLVLLLTAYSLLNYYFIRKQRNIMTSKSLPACLIKLVMFAVILTPFITYFFAREGMPFLAAIMGFTGYSWLAFLFLFFFIHALIDLLLFIAEKLGYSPPRYTAKAIFIITMVLCAGILVYGWHEAKAIQVNHVVIETTKLPPDVKSLRIVQLSDIHFSPLTGADAAKRIKDIVEKEKPDLLLSTGDLLDPGIRDFDQVAMTMRQIKAPLGKYASTGNHEFISNIAKSTAFTGLLGFTLLRNESTNVKDILTLAAIDDPAGKRFGIASDATDRGVLKDLDHDIYTIFLKHRPTFDEENLELFDLQLSGHAHAGQIFPFTLLVKLVYPYMAGLYALDDNTNLYVSRGTGTWGPPIRFLAFPEITVFDLKNVSQLPDN